MEKQKENKIKVFSDVDINQSLEKYIIEKFKGVFD